MGVFFHRSRRKTGVVTLVMAWVFMSGWVRSYAFEDGVSVGLRQSRREFSMFVSFQSGIHFLQNRPKLDDGPRVFSPCVDWFSQRISGASFLSHPELKWKWHLAGFGVRECSPPPRNLGGGLLIDWVVPYWSIAMPLTLLSAYLLLNKPRDVIKNHGNVLPQSQVAGD